MVSFDRPFAGRTVAHTDHAGLICPTRNLCDDIGGQIRVLAEFADTHTLETTTGQVFWLG